MCVNPSVPVCPVCFVFMCESRKSTSKNHVIWFKPSVYLMPCCIKNSKLAGTKLLRLDKVRSIILLSKSMHQICCDHAFTQRNKARKMVGWVGGMDKIWKREDKQYGGGSVPKIRGLGNPMPAMCSYAKFYCSEVRGPKLYGLKRVIFLVIKTLYYLEYVFNSLKLTTFERLKRFIWINCQIQHLKINPIMLLFWLSSSKY